MSLGSFRSSVLTAVLIMSAVGAIIAGLMFGVRPLRPRELFSILLAPDDGVDSILVWTLRLPRSLSAFVGGAGLGVSGYLLQTLARNPLAGPGLTGVTSGAVTPIVFCFIFLPSVSPVFYPFIGMIGGVAAAMVTFWISDWGRRSPLHLALGGISVSIFFNAVTTYILLLSGSLAFSLMHWLSGGFQGLAWRQLAFMTPLVAAGIAGTLACRRIVGLLMLDEQVAAGMGLRLAFWKPLLLVFAVLPVAGIVPVAGTIAFVGLAAPHIARLLRPKDPFWSVALSAAIGALMVVVADIVARTVALPRDLPVSVIAALIGGPVFIYLAQRRDFSTKGKI